jgi:hypothetical protein
MKESANQFLFSLYLSLMPLLYVLIILVPFHPFYCMLHISEMYEMLTFKMGTFIAVVYYRYEMISLFLRTNGK